MKDIGNELMPWVGRTAKMMGLVLTEKFQAHGLDLTKIQWLLLSRLCEKDGQLQKELAFLTGRDKTSLGRLVTTMERKGFINRIPMESDKRTKQIFLTDKGKTTYLQAVPVVQMTILEVQHNIPSEKLEKAIEVLKQIQHNINQMNNNSVDVEQDCY